MAFVGGPLQVGKTTLALGMLGSTATEKHPAYLCTSDASTLNGDPSRCCPIDAFAAIWDCPDELLPRRHLRRAKPPAFPPSSRGILAACWRDTTSRSGPRGVDG